MVTAWLVGDVELRNFGEKKRTNVIGALCAGSLLTASLLIPKFLKLGLNL